MANQIFVTYNQNAYGEQNTALRLQTIANLYGISVALPARNSGNNPINDETRNRIKNSDFVLAFSLNGMQENVSHELGDAIAKKKPIVVIYDKNNGRNINFKDYPHIKEVFMDMSNSEEALHDITGFINTELNKKNDKNQNVIVQTGIAVVGIAVGLLMLLFNGNKNK